MINVTISLTIDQVRQLILGHPIKMSEAKHVGKRASGTAPAQRAVMDHLTYYGAGDGKGRTPTVADVEQYAVKPGDRNASGRGRTNKLTVAGMEAVWKLYQDGYNVAEIGRAFKGVIGDEAIRRLIKKIQKAGK